MIYFLQPAIPKYRVSFFRELASLIGKDKFRVFSGLTDPFGLESERNENSYQVEFCCDFISFKNIFFWQKNILSLRKNFTRNDIVVFNGNIRNFSQMLLFFYCKAAGIKTVWWGQLWTAGSRGLFTFVRHRIMLLSNAIVTYTQKEAESLKLDKAFGLNNGLEKIRPLSSCSSTDLCDDNIVRVLFIGRITNKSNLEFALKAVSSIQSRPLEFHIVGDGEKFKYLSNLYSSNSFFWYGAIYDQCEISKICSKMDVMLYPGSVGLSIIHAFNYSIPVILHDNESEHMPEYAAFQHNYNGINFKYGSLNSLVNVLNNVDKNQLGLLGINAKDTVNHTFNTEDMAFRFRGVLKFLGSKL